MKRLHLIFGVILVGVGFQSAALADAREVVVVNTPTVTDADHPARNAFQITLCTIGWPPGCLSTPSTVHVPNDKHLVIEFVSGQCNTDGANEIMTAAILATTANRAQVSHRFLPVHTLTTATLNGYQVSQQTRLYADPGTAVAASAESYTRGAVGCLLNISGYFVTP
jgi:hypothetical protein